MAFENLHSQSDILLEAGHVDHRSWVDYMDVLEAEQETLEAGMAIGFDFSGNQQVALNTGAFNGVNVKGSTELGQTCTYRANPEICTLGYVMVQLTAGQVQPANGQAGKVAGDGRFEADNGTDAVGNFTGLAGKTNADGFMTAQIRILKGV